MSIDEPDAPVLMLRHFVSGDAVIPAEAGIQCLRPSAQLLDARPRLGWGQESKTAQHHRGEHESRQAPASAVHCAAMDAARLQFDSTSEADTAALGRAFAAALEPGVCVALVGELGAGKTRFVQAVAAGMGVDRDQVASPTFVLIHEYRGRIPLYHFDAYRLKDTDEFLELGAEELLESAGVCLIEWADRVAAVLPPDRVTIEIDATGPTSRRFVFGARGERSRGVIERLTRTVGSGQQAE
ncbi:MAG: tRNA (adenosine(37)-N6)-threonylcarbamoyltransferase complex ATPase subunit type 1 TsaE [Planctomycetales bacterium]